MLIIMTVAPALGAQALVINIVQDQDNKPYQQTVASFKAALKEAHPDVEFTHGEHAGVETSRLVFALGSSAVRDSLTHSHDTLLLATMILSGEQLRGSSQATAILLKTSAEKQLEWHRRMLPDAKQVGVLYDPKHNQQWVDEANISAAKLGLEIIALPVSSAQELSPALKVLGRKADSIMGIVDKTVYSGKTAQEVLLFSFRNRIPFVGLSSAWVKAGALYALDWDYSALGRQCADLALDILNGKKANTTNLQVPNKQQHILNLKTARQMKVSIDKALIDKASKVYE